MLGSTHVRHSSLRTEANPSGQPFPTASPEVWSVARAAAVPGARLPRESGTEVGSGQIPAASWSSCGGPRLSIISSVAATLENEILWKTTMRERQRTLSPTTPPSARGGSPGRPWTASTSSSHQQQDAPATPAPPQQPPPPVRGPLYHLSSPMIGPTVMARSFDEDPAAASSSTPPDSPTVTARDIALHYVDEVSLTVEGTGAVGVVAPGSFRHMPVVAAAAPRPPTAGSATGLSPSPRQPRIQSANRRSGSARSVTSVGSAPVLGAEAAVAAAGTRGHFPASATSTFGPRNQGILTEVVVKRTDLPVSNGVFRHLVTYERQGNKDFYTSEGILKRRALRNHFAVIDKLELFWSELPKRLQTTTQHLQGPEHASLPPSTTPSSSSATISLHVFYWMHKKLYLHLSSEPSDELWTAIALEDWKTEATDRHSMSEKEFHKFMFHLADTWCQTTEVEEYVSFLSECQRIVFLLPPSFHDYSRAAVAFGGGANATIGGGGGGATKKSSSSGSSIRMQSAGLGVLVVAMLQGDTVSGTESGRPPSKRSATVPPTAPSDASSDPRTTGNGAQRGMVESAFDFDQVRSQQREQFGDGAAAPVGLSGVGTDGEIPRDEGNHEYDSEEDEYLISLDQCCSLQPLQAGGGAEGATRKLRPAISKDDVASAFKIQTLQAVAAAKQCAKVVEACISSGVAEMDDTEVRQLQGLLRLISEVEEREDDELSRLLQWCRAFHEDHVSQHALKDTEVAVFTQVVLDGEPQRAGQVQANAAPTPLAMSSMGDVRYLQRLEATMSEFVETFANSRQALVAQMTKLLDQLGGTTSAGQEQQRSAWMQSIVSVRQRISQHWRSGRDDRATLRDRLRDVVGQLRQQLDCVLYAMRLRSPLRTFSSEDAAVAAAVVRELKELERQVHVEGRTSDESTLLIAFVTKQLATQKPIAALLETSLSGIVCSKPGDSLASASETATSETEIGSTLWRKHITAIAKVEVGLYNVTDALHQEMQRGLLDMFNTCDVELGSGTSSTHPDEGVRGESRKPNAPPFSLTIEQNDFLSASREELRRQAKALRETTSEAISEQRLRLNKFFTDMCCEEAKLLASATNDVGVRSALESRRSFHALHQRAIIVEQHWFTTIPDSRPTPIGREVIERYFCSPRFFAYVQHLNAEWTAQFLGELTTTLSAVVMEAFHLRREHNRRWAALLEDAEIKARSASAGPSAVFPIKSLSPRTLTQRQNMSPVVDVATSHLIHTTIVCLISAPQAAMVCRSESLMRKAYEWKDKMLTTEIGVSTIRRQRMPKTREELRQCRAAGKPLFDDLVSANQEIEAYLQSQVEKQEALALLKKGELDNLALVRAVKEVRDRSKNALRILRESKRRHSKEEVDGSGAVVDAEMVATAAEQRRTLDQAKLQRIAKAAAALRQATVPSLAPAVPTTQTLSLGTTTEGLTPSPFRHRESSSGSGVTAMQQLMTCASSATRRPPDGIAVSDYIGNAAYETRKRAFLLNRCSNSDIFVGECMDLGVAVVDLARAQLNILPRRFDASIFPLQGISFPSSPRCTVGDLLKDLVWLNPLQQLCLSTCNLDDEALRRLGKLLAGHRTLISLDLRFNRALTDGAAALKLVDANDGLLFLFVDGCSFSEKDQLSIQQACIEHREEKSHLTAAEANLLGSHIRVLRDANTGFLSLDSIEAVRAASSTQRFARGDNGSPICALQGLVAAFCLGVMRRTDRWTPHDLVRTMFPRWSKAVVGVAADAIQQAL